MYKETIGIEVHLELRTNTKFFSKSPNSYGKLPNSCVSLVDVAHPGTLPTINKEVINQGLRAALLLNCTINKTMHFDRKNYFYPDLPKGYQITQARTPIGINGYITLDSGKRIGIHDIHLEEDTAKSIHGENESYLDFNRAGIPLVEIVSMPDISNSEEAREYLEKLKELMVFAGISDCKIEEGSMRCDVNISVSKNQSLGNRAEVKNISSFTAVENAIKYEKERQIKLLENNEIVEEDTRRFDEKDNKTYRLRLKEVGNDYRYFPEPDIPYIYLTDDEINDLKEKLPPKATEIKKVLISKGVSELNANKILSSTELALFIANFLNDNIDFLLATNLLIGDISSYLNRKNISLKKTKITKERFNNLLNSFKNGMNMRIFRDVVDIFMESDLLINEILLKENINIIASSDDLSKIIDEVIAENPVQVKEYLDGNERLLKYLMGMIMKKTSGGADPKISMEILNKNLSKK